jgi:hypothetical protein
MHRCGLVARRWDMYAARPTPIQHIIVFGPKQLHAKCLLQIADRADNLHAPAFSRLFRDGQTQFAKFTFSLCEIGLICTVLAN